MQRLDEAKREAILQAAKHRLSQYGVRKTTMQEIAGEVGLAVGTLYLYFKNKNEILIATAEAYAQHHIKDTEKILRQCLHLKNSKPISLIGFVQFKKIASVDLMLRNLLVR